ncbi:putative metallophosphoesterase [Magnetofaba australis IT-1]|uniref:Putative metallophosphoesterase n=2 Tax=Magnetofaba TaxID=1472292 RepID=A0A1Y2K1U5_9PROT|nr:putative metallophosphoesterase [Magnetofaba australis IT-1]
MLRGMSDRFQFIHCADVHLDSPLTALSARFEHAAQPPEGLPQITRRAWDRLIDQAIERRVAFVLAAGDLFDDAIKDYQTSLYFVRSLERLEAAGIPLIAVRGNHDAANKENKTLSLPPNVTFLSESKAETLLLDEWDVAIHGRGYARVETRESLLPGYPPPSAGRLNIGLLHTALSGRGEHANYAPCDEADLIAKGYDYWALGHVHQWEVQHQPGAPWIVFPGNLQGRNIRETGVKGFALATVSGGVVEDVERIPCDVLRWAHAQADLKGATSFDTAQELIAHALGAALAEAQGRPLLARVSLFNVTAALRGDVEKLLFEAQQEAERLSDQFWIEKIKTHAPPPEPRRDAVDNADSLLDEARALLDEPEVQQELAALRDALLTANLPDDARNALAREPLETLLEGALTRLDEALRTEPEA